MKLSLYHDQFVSEERELFRDEEFAVRSFTYATGVEALRIENSVGEMIVLPYQGQQIWDLSMFGRRQTMQTAFRAPVPNVEYLRTYGGFLLHCGFTAMGGPGPEDNHGLHGELPNARYEEAWITGGEDENGRYIGVAGRFEYTMGFGPHYLAVPEVRMYTRSGAIRVLFDAQNLSRTAMEYMYLCHVNFRPIDNATLLYTAEHDSDHIRVRDNIPAHLNVTDEYRAFLQSLRENPAQHDVLDPALPYNPEAVLFIDMRSDEEGWAHSMQRLPTGEADFISYRPSELDHAVRWISRTPDQNALGLVLPATAEPDGFTAEKAKGNVKTLPAGEHYSCDFFTGALSAPASMRYARHIDSVAEGTGGTIRPVLLDAESH